MIHDPDEVVHAIVHHNRQHFAQAKRCALSHQDLMGVVDPNSEMYNNFSVSSLEEEFINELRQHQLTLIPTLVDIHDWTTKIMTWRESTRTSPSGVHLGHFKSLLSPLYVWDDDKCEVDQELLLIQQDLFGATLRILNLAVLCERPLTRWKRAQNFIIPKKPNNFELKNPRNIHIYEYDLNALLSLK